MPSWLDEEERLKALQELRDREDAIVRDRLRSQEKEVLSRLARLRALCDRVNAVRPNSLSITERKIDGPIYDTGRSPGVRREVLMGKQRGVQFGRDVTGDVRLEAVITELLDTGDIDEFDRSRKRTIVLVRHACSPHEIDRWAEEHMLAMIKWLLNEGETFKDALPGKEVANAEGRLLVRLAWSSSRHADRYFAGAQVLVDGCLLAHVNHTDETNFGEKGQVFHLPLGGHDLTVRGSGSSASETIRLAAHEIVRYEVTFGFFGGITLKRVTTAA